MTENDIGKIIIFDKDHGPPGYTAKITGIITRIDNQLKLIGVRSFNEKRDEIYLNKTIHNIKILTLEEEIEFKLRNI